jgi:hypothetical protein
MSDAARPPAPAVTDGDASPATREPAGDRALRAWINVQHLRGLRLASLRRTALASLPVWVGARWTLPGLLAWLALLLHASLAVESVAYAWLEHLWARRARAANPPAVGLHILGTTGQRLGSGCWYGVGAVSLVAWIDVALGREAPVWLRSALPALAGAMGALVLAACLLEGLGGRSRGDEPLAEVAADAEVMKPSHRRT